MTEARQEEAQQCASATTPMPDISTARQALAIHGERENFRTITVTFDTPEQAATFDQCGARHDLFVGFVADRKQWQQIEGIHARVETR